jgi:hypothetical protein
MERAKHYAQLNHWQTQMKVSCSAAAAEGLVVTKFFPVNCKWSKIQAIAIYIDKSDLQEMVEFWLALKRRRVIIRKDVDVTMFPRATLGTCRRACDQCWFPQFI